jgi:hypothetical protein
MARSVYRLKGERHYQRQHFLSDLEAVTTLVTLFFILFLLKPLTTQYAVFNPNIRPAYLCVQPQPSELNDVGKRAYRFSAFDDFQLRSLLILCFWFVL